MSCERASSDLHAYLDGELDAAGAAAFERHLESCRDCASALAAQEALRRSLERAALRERAPEGLRRKLDAALGPPRRGTAFRTAAPAWRSLAIAASVLLVAVVGWRQLAGLIGPRDTATLASSIVDAHLRSLQPGHLVDVVSTDQHTVKPWFDGRIDFAPPVRDLAADGFPLEGGRLDVIGGRTVAVVVYARRKHVINVFEWPATDREAAPSSGARLGYNWVAWSKDGMHATAVSDVSAADLEELRRLLTR